LCGLLSASPKSIINICTYRYQRAIGTEAATTEEEWVEIRVEGNGFGARVEVKYEKVVCAVIFILSTVLRQQIRRHSVDAALQAAARLCGVQRGSVKAA
jgi:hypothetical protein